MEIRPATDDDAAAIAQIYNHAVAHSPGLWVETPVSVANRVAWMQELRDQGHPVLVSHSADQVTGYGAYGPWRPHDGYRHSVEHSVYVRHDARGHGLGRALLAALIAQARAAGLHAMIGALDAQNEASLALHRAFGFDEIGTLPEVGCKAGAWRSLTLMQLQLDDRPAP